MEFIPSAQRERSKAFDEIVTATDQLLHDPHVYNELSPDLQQRYEKVIAGAFLPDVRHGVAELPRDQEGGNGFAILPLLSQDEKKGIRLAPSMFTPTADRFDKIHADLAARYGFTPMQSVDAISPQTWDMQNLIERNVAAMPARVHARTTSIGEHLNDNGPLITARPTMIVGINTVKSGRLKKGAVALHELWHGMDVERLTRLPSNLEDWVTYSESKAGRITHLCLEAAGVVAGDQVVDREYVTAEGFWACLQFERMRRQANPAENPYATNPQLVERITRAQRKAQ
ncbi:MAG TPA: hypothetical protein VFH39_01385 [Candidatus Saccharimonadales bacterium]|nr:hypothetical protein [Candidatus Saccharimonadales bacterium]